MGKKVGAERLDNESCLFRTWSPFAERVEVVLKDRSEPVAMQKDEQGYWETVIKDTNPPWPVAEIVLHHQIRLVG